MQNYGGYKQSDYQQVARFAQGREQFRNHLKKL